MLPHSELSMVAAEPSCAHPRHRLATPFGNDLQTAWLSDGRGWDRIGDLSRVNGAQTGPERLEGTVERFPAPSRRRFALVWPVVLTVSTGLDGPSWAMARPGHWW